MAQGDLWEWIAQDPTKGTKGDRRTVRSAKGAAERPSRGARDVTFRLVASP